MKKTALWLALALGAFGVSACQQEQDAGDQMEEAAEQTGEAMEEAAEETGEAMEEAGEAVEEATEPNNKPAPAGTVFSTALPAPEAGPAPAVSHAAGLGRFPSRRASARGRVSKAPAS